MIQERMSDDAIETLLAQIKADIAASDKPPQSVRLHPDTLAQINEYLERRAKGPS